MKHTRERLQEIGQKEIDISFHKQTYDKQNHEVINPENMPVIHIEARLLFNREKRKINKVGSQSQPSFSTIIDKSFVSTMKLQKTEKCNHIYLFIEKAELYEPDGATFKADLKNVGYSFLVTQPEEEGEKNQ